MTDVTIPADVAKQISAWLRDYRYMESGDLIGNPDVEWADLLDPPSPSLREQVVAVLWSNWSGPWTLHQIELTDAVLAVVADWLEAQPIAPRNDVGLIFRQRDHDVRIIRGEAS